MKKEELSISPLLNTVISNGYKAKGYGYVRKTLENTHWITLFKSGGIQMYAYFTEDEDCDKIYDSGIIDVSEDELETLIKVLIRNHD